jgi:hypothetical protein
MNLRRQGSSPKQYTEPTEADKLYQEGLSKGLDPKTAAKAAQAATGLSLLTGQRMRTKGFGWQNLKIQV